MTSVKELLAVLAEVDVDVDARHDAAHELARLGDPRLDGALVWIPEGVLQHRASHDAAPEPTPMSGFALQRHLVSVAEFAEFVEEGGYDDPALWTADGWRWRLDDDIVAPRFWDEEEWQPYLVPNQPVVGVSWFEADAYASFRGRRLPSELELERGARGDDARRYPWGDTWDERLCAHRTSGRRTTKPIGLFPPGPWGLHDLVGSVWQWTREERGEVGPYGAPRVVCGGAWNNLPWSIGCASRNAFPPTARFSNLGFRCASDS